MDIDTIADDLRDRSRLIIDAELRRLARRAPDLREGELDAVEAVLIELVERLVLAGLRANRHRADQFRLLFDIAEVGP